MANNPWDNDPILQASPQQSNPFVVPPDPRRVAEHQAAENRAAMAAQAAQQAAMDRHNEWAASHNQDGSPKVVAPPLLGDPTKTGPAYLATLPDNIRNRVQQLLDGRSILTAREKGQPLGQQLMDAANQVDPNFGEDVSHARYTERQQYTGMGKGSLVVQAADRLASHLNDLYAASNKLSGPNLWFAPLSNLAAKVGQSFEQADLVRYNTTLPLIAGELQKLTKNGAATVDESKHIMENLAPGHPRDVRNAAIQEIARLGEAQFQPLRESWASAWQGRDAPPMPMDFNPKTNAILDAIAKGDPAVEFDRNGNPVGMLAHGGGTSGPGGNGGHGGPGGPGQGGAGGSGGNGSQPPPTPWNQDTTGGGSAPSLAAGSDPTKAVLIPPAMQSEFQQWMAQNRANLDPDKYAAERSALDQKYGFAVTPAQTEIYRNWAAGARKTVEQGGNLSVVIPPAEAGMSAAERIKNTAFNNPVGAFVAGAGSLGGGIDEVAGGINSVLHGTDYGVERDKADAIRQALANEHPWATPIGGLAGGIATAYAGGSVIPRLAQAGGSLAGTLGLGGGMGAVSGALENNDNRLGGAVGGAVGGAAGGLMGRYVVGPAAEALARSRAGQSVANTAIGAANMIPGVNIALRDAPRYTPVQAAMKNIAPDLATVRTNVADAADMGLPYALADAHPKLQMLAGKVSRVSPDARTLAQATFAPRQGDQAERGMQAVDKMLAPTVDMTERQQYWRDAGDAQAGPLYKQAFAGGSTAPLESQLGEAFNASSKGVADARAALAEAQRNLTQTAAGVNRAGDNVYMNARALPQQKAASDAVAAAQNRVATAEAQHADVVDRLRAAQSDGASNAPGAVWNPRLQQFIDDPLSKVGLARGLEVQRLEALAQNKPFDPSEFAVVGQDASGAPIVGNVPNMRTMDAIKRGYDAILNDAPRDMRGNQVFSQRDRAIIQAKQALVGELDKLNPDYAAARDTYATYAKMGNALDAGYAAQPKGTYARDISANLRDMTPEQTAEYQSGFATRMRNQMADASDSTDPLKLVYGGNERRAKINTVFPDAAPRFARYNELERHMAGTNQETLGGPATAQRLTMDQAFGPDLAAAALDATTVPLTGGGIGIGQLIKSGIPVLKDKLQERFGTSPVQQATDIAGKLFDTSNPASILDYINQMGTTAAEIERRKQAAKLAGGFYGSLLGPQMTGSMLNQ